MWTVRAEPVDSAAAVALLRSYFAELTVRWFHRETTPQEIDETLQEHSSSGLAVFLVLRADAEPAGCLGVHPTGELTRMYVAPRFRRRGGARALLAAAESWARSQGLPRLFLDTRTDLVEARACYVSCGFVAHPRRLVARSRTTGSRSRSGRELRGLVLRPGARKRCAAGGLTLLSTPGTELEKGWDCRRLPVASVHGRSQAVDGR